MIEKIWMFFKKVLVEILVILAVGVFPTTILMEKIKENYWILGTILGAVISIMLSVELWKKCKYSDVDRKLDKKVYEEIKKTISPDDDVLNTLRDFNFNRTAIPEWVGKQFSPFIRLYDGERNNLKLLFRNKDLEKSKNELFDRIEEFVLVWVNAHHHGANRSFYGDLMFRHDKDPEGQKKAKQANSLATEIYKLHQKFYRLIQKKLKIN